MIFFLEMEIENRIRLSIIPARLLASSFNVNNLFFSL